MFLSSVEDFKIKFNIELIKSNNNSYILLRDKLLLYVYRGMTYYMLICIGYTYEISLVVVSLSLKFFY